MNLVALTLETEVPLDMEFPCFPKLKELNIRGTDLLPILTQCQGTLETLTYSGNYIRVQDLEARITKLFRPRFKKTLVLVKPRF